VVFASRGGVVMLAVSQRAEVSKKANLQSLSRLHCAAVFRDAPGETCLLSLSNTRHAACQLKLYSFG
jgi:hypothetical protein